ncbi:hypothetical protein VZT92_013829 [Zoarces viviparus]|uniref:Uncharacterized protein n=1 Tax=Zoarces viviparus TaxID=48416 RepID=A0AAW1F685_ZOAVI
MGDLTTAARAVFPLAIIYMTKANMALGEEQGVRDRIETLNGFIENLPDYIPTLAQEQFHTLEDGVHWTRGTGGRVWALWRRCLEIQEPVAANPGLGENHGIVNLSSRLTLGPEHKRLLRKGLSFILTPGTIEGLGEQRVRLKEDLAEIGHSGLFWGYILRGKGAVSGGVRMGTGPGCITSQLLQVFQADRGMPGNIRVRQEGDNLTGEERRVLGSSGGIPQ